MDRRAFLTSAGLLSAAFLEPIARTTSAASAKGPVGRAEACIFIWLGGGACHVDTWDPKRKGDPQKKVAGSAYDAIDTCVKGVQVCQHLKRMADLLDRCVPLRSLHHDVVDEHAAATNRLHTGRPVSGTITYPSVGSVVAHQRAGADGVPGYVLIGYPNVTRGPGFLGAEHGYIYLTETDLGPNGLVRPADVGADRQARREALLAEMRQAYLERNQGDEKVENYAAVGAKGLKLAGPQFLSVFNVKEEKAALRETYGGEFGQRCLLARRLVQAGVRFVEVSFNLNFVNGTGWDTHNEGQQNQHLLIEHLDQALAALIRDLESRKMLDRTLIVVATEFGRPPEFDGRGGRGHHSQAFSALLAGGGLKTGQVIGATDALGKKIVSRPVSVPDFHATIYAALGINPAKNIYAGDRPVPLTDGGVAIKELFG